MKKEEDLNRIWDEGGWWTWCGERRLTLYDSHLHDVSRVWEVSRGRGRYQAGRGGGGTGDALSCNEMKEGGSNVKMERLNESKVEVH